MKKRILFVDDEPLVLAGLQRTLRKLRSDYDMEFAEGGEQALQLMSQTTFDVVVTDMRMPGMTGAELLGHVRTRYPSTIRFVLSGHADQEMIAQCHGVAHQFLSKPCDPDLLERSITHASLLGEMFRGKDMAAILNRIEKLPSMPNLYVELSRALASEDVSAQRLGGIIERDVGMTAKILKLVNSAFFGLPREIAHPAEAVTYLGIETVRSLVLAHGIFGDAELTTEELSLQQLWNHSLSVAVGARSLSTVLDPSGGTQDTAFSGGLLHDVGYLILAHNFPDAFDEMVARVRRKAQSGSEAEQELLGVRHEEVGAYLMGLWGLPPAIIRGILYHHHPMVQPDDVVAVIHLSDVTQGWRLHHPLWEEMSVEGGLSALPRLRGHWSQLMAMLQQGPQSRPSVTLTDPMQDS